MILLPHRTTPPLFYFRPQCFSTLPTKKPPPGPKKKKKNKTNPKLIVLKLVLGLSLNCDRLSFSLLFLGLFVCKHPHTHKQPGTWTHNGTTFRCKITLSEALPAGYRQAGLNTGGFLIGLWRLSTNKVIELSSHSFFRNTPGRIVWFAPLHRNGVKLKIIGVR